MKLVLKHQFCPEKAKPDPLYVNTGPVMEGRGPFSGPRIELFPFSQGVLLDFCPFDPTRSGAAVQNKRPPADSKY